MGNLNTENEWIEAELFEWFLPGPPKPIFLLTVHNGGEICLNGKLCEYVPKEIKIGVNHDGKELRLAQCYEHGYRVPKNGRIKDLRLANGIEKRGVALPAKYTVTNRNEVWVADLIPASPTDRLRRTPKKPRLNGLRAMLPQKD